MLEIVVWMKNPVKKDEIRRTGIVINICACVYNSAKDEKNNENRLDVFPRVFTYVAASQKREVTAFLNILLDFESRVESTVEGIGL